MQPSAPTPAEAQAFLELAHALADAAGAAALPYFRRPDLVADNKAGAGGFDPVTAADRAAEEAMRALLARHRPQDGISGEEFPPHAGESGYTWVLDPIDGTRGFISGTPTWGTLIALNQTGHGPVLGIIDQPYIRERFWGGFGEAKSTGPHGNTSLAVSGCETLANATLFSTFPEIGTPNERDAFARVASKTRLVRYGMDCYAYALLAAGMVDLVIEAGLQAYDIQAPLALVEAAGGVVSTWEGGKADQGGQVIAAATPQLHAAAIKQLQ